MPTFNKLFKTDLAGRPDLLNPEIHNEFVLDVSKSMKQIVRPMIKVDVALGIKTSLKFVNPYFDISLKH